MGIAYTWIDEGKRYVADSEGEGRLAAPWPRNTTDAIRGAARELVRLAEENRLLKRAAAKMCEGFDKGIWQRSIQGDDRPDWAIQFLPYGVALGKLANLCGHLSPPQEEAGAPAGTSAPSPQG